MQGLSESMRGVSFPNVLEQRARSRVSPYRNGGSADATPSWVRWGEGIALKTIINNCMSFSPPEVMAVAGAVIGVQTADGDGDADGDMDAVIAKPKEF